MKRKIFFYLVLLAGIAVIATSVLVTITAHHDFYKAIQQEVIAEASYLRIAYEHSGDAFLAKTDHLPGHRLTIVLPDGEVLYDSTSNPGIMDNHIDRPEIQAALAAGVGESTRFSNTLHEQTYYYAVRLENGSVLRMSSTVASIIASYGNFFWLVVFIAGLVLLAAIGLASLITKKIVNPVNDIDLDCPENNVIYEELIPLLKRIKEQRFQIDAQMKELARGQREFSAITENMNEGFLVLDPNGKVLSFNQSAIKMLNLQNTGSSGDNILLFNRSEALRNIVQSALHGIPKEQIVEINGRQCLLFANPVIDNGSMHGVILLLMDVTEKQEREKLRREFTANVSHELKTPLTTISGYAEIISTGVAKREDIPRFAKQMYTEAQRLVTLVDDIMMLSKLDEGAVTPSREIVDLYLLTEEIVRRVSAPADALNIKITLDGKKVFVSVIRQVVDEMIFNILDNAVKYNIPGGSINILIHENRGEAVLRVADTGTGIPENEQERVFERFYRVDRSRGETIPGTGLGLSIVKHGAMLHNASINLVSNGSSGTTVILRFPI